MSARRTTTLPLSQDQIARLVEAGYTRVRDLRAAQPARLAQDVGCTPQEALAILKAVAKAKVGRGITAPSVSSVSSVSSSASSACAFPQQAAPAQTSSSAFSTSPAASSSSAAATPTAVGLRTRAGNNALTMLKSARKRAGIVTFSAEIDKQMFSGSGGVPIGQMTEFCGAPGMGKTQICMQLACNVAIPRLMGGVSGACVYIDTEGSFMVDRVHEIASALETHLRKNKHRPNNKSASFSSSSSSSSSSSTTSSSTSSSSSSSSSSSLPAGHSDIILPSASDILGKIHCFRVHDHAEQLAVVKTLPAFIRDHPDVRLVVLDSVAFHFRHGFHNRYAERARILSQLAQDLNRLADKSGLAVVVTNHVTTRLNRNDGGSGNGRGGDGDAYLAPALGEAWSHAATNRVELFWNNKTRTARLTKSPSLGLMSVPFQIVAEGVRGLAHRSTGSKRTGAGSVSPVAPAAKRQRVA